MTWELHRHDARRLSDLLEPGSVDLIVTSPPYFALRSYRDGGEHYDGQLGSEATPGEFVDNLIACTRDWIRVMRPGGSIFVNLGDKFAGSAGWAVGAATAASSTLNGQSQQARVGMTDKPVDRTKGYPAKSRMGLPWRYAIRCIDELGLILRADIIWNKPNGLPESVTDRVRMSHEYLFHFTLQGRYYAAIDEVREASNPDNAAHSARYNEAAKTYGKTNNDRGDKGAGLFIHNPLGKVPGSVWTMPSEPLVVPDHLGVDHFAAFPSELPRRIILGWTPTGWCQGCGEPRRPVVEKAYELHGGDRGDGRGYSVGRGYLTGDSTQWTRSAGRATNSEMRLGKAHLAATITGYTCACPNLDAPTRPAVVVDPFAGTGTTVAVAHLLGRHGIGTDLSADYLRLADWRCTADRALRDKVLERSDLPRAPAVDGQLNLFGEGIGL